MSDCPVPVKTVKKQRILINFHIISAYNSEISSELSEWARNYFRNCPNTPYDLGKKFGIVRILRIDLGKKFGIVRIDLGKNSEFRIKVGNYHPYSENIVSSEKISALALPLLVQFLSFIRKKIPNYIWKKFPNYIC